MKSKKLLELLLLKEVRRDLAQENIELKCEYGLDLELDKFDEIINFHIQTLSTHKEAPSQVIYEIGLINSKLKNILVCGG